MKKTVVMMTVIAMLCTMTMGLHVSAALVGGSRATNFDSNTLNTDLWSIQSIAADGTSDPAKVSLNNGALVFNGAGDGCSFGPTALYKDFTMQFDVLSVEEGSTFIGVCFGMDEPYDNFWDAGANMVYFQVATTDAFKDGNALTTSDSVGVGTDDGNGRGWTRPGYELFSADGPNPETLTYKIVVKDGAAEVYYKKASDPDSVLDILRIRYVGFGDTTGFVKIASTAGASYTLDNFQIIDDTPLIADFEGNAYDQSKWAISSINADGTASMDKVAAVNNALTFAGAGDGCYFGSLNQYKDFILSFDIVSVEEGSTFIGACFGMDNLEDNFWAPGGNMVYFQVATTDAFKDGNALTTSDSVGVGTDDGNGRGWTRPGYELFSADGPNPEVLNYKLVVHNGSAEVYYKKASDPASELKVLRIRYVGFGDTTGYVKLVSTAGANYTLDNIKISPLSTGAKTIVNDTDAKLAQNSTTNLAVNSSDIMASSLKLQWAKDDTASTYRINVYSKGTDNSYTFVKTITLGNETGTIVNGLSENTSYGFQIASLDQFGFINNYYTMKDASTVTAASATPTPTTAPAETPEDNPTTGDASIPGVFAGILLAACAVILLQKKNVKE